MRHCCERSEQQHYKKFSGCAAAGMPWYSRFVYTGREPESVLPDKIQQEDKTNEDCNTGSQFAGSRCGSERF